MLLRAVQMPAASALRAEKVIAERNRGAHPCVAQLASSKLCGEPVRKGNPSTHRYAPVKEPGEIGPLLDPNVVILLVYSLQRAAYKRMLFRLPSNKSSK